LRKAAHLQLKALEFFQKANDKRNIAYAYNAIGMVYLSWQKYNLAQENFQKSLSIRKDIGDKDGMSQSYVNLATVYTAQKKYDEALKYYEINSPVIEQLDNKYRMAENCIGMGEMYTFTGKYDLAEKCLLNAVAIAKVINYKKSLVYGYDNLSELEKRRGNYRKALDYAQLSVIEKEHLYTEEKAKQIAAIEARYEFEKKDQVISLLAGEKEIYQLRSNILVAAFVLVVIAAIGVFVLQRFREKKNRTILNLEIDYLTNQHRELSERIKSAISETNTKSIESQDQRLLRRAIEVVENNLADPMFSVEKMARDMGMSRTNMHRKIKAITGFPPSELIRSIRLRKAAVLIVNKVDSVSQISMMVGFEDHSYFSKLFKKQFGVPPSEYRELLSKISQLISPNRYYDRNSNGKGPLAGANRINQGFGLND
jgi:AraC-like DNA-binding protein